MMWEWSQDRFVRVNGRWLLAGAVTAVEPTIAGNARVHLTGGTTLDVPLREGQTVDHVMNTIAKEART